MTIDELFAVREQMQEVLGAKLKAKKVELEHRLRTLNQSSMKSRRRRLVKCAIDFPRTKRRCLNLVGDDVPADFCDVLKPLPTELPA